MLATFINSHKIYHEYTILRGGWKVGCRGVKAKREETVSMLLHCSQATCELAVDRPRWKCCIPTIAIAFSLVVYYFILLSAALFITLYLIRSALLSDTNGYDDTLMSLCSAQMLWAFETSNIFYTAQRPTWLTSHVPIEYTLLMLCDVEFFYVFIVLASYVTDIWSINTLMSKYEYNIISLHITTLVYVEQTKYKYNCSDMTTLYSYIAVIWYGCMQNII